jgi:hypothetical protein
MEKSNKVKAEQFCGYGDFYTPWMEGSVHERANIRKHCNILDKKKKICRKCGTDLSYHAEGKFQEGRRVACPNDWFVEESDGKIHLVRNEIFQQKYTYIEGK